MVSHPGMHCFSVSGSLSRSQTRWRGAGMRRSPVISMRVVLGNRGGASVVRGGGDCNFAPIASRRRRPCLSPQSAVCYTTRAMTVPFQQRFVALAAERSALCVGIDPSADSLKGWGLPDDAEGLQAFCERMVEVCAPLVACVKPQSSFFERHGAAGMAVLRRTGEAARSHGALGIIDANRAHIESTAPA